MFYSGTEVALLMSLTRRSGDIQGWRDCTPLAADLYERVSSLRLDAFIDDPTPLSMEAWLDKKKKSVLSSVLRHDTRWRSPGTHGGVSDMKQRTPKVPWSERLRLWCPDHHFGPTASGLPTFA